ncbi:MAG: hypothetical protein Q8R92_19165 [Deltaproteobacteria bacterium]|nr:hypothetical protein [Deltaproteobacteria bacterium]
MNGRILCFALALAFCLLSLPANAEVKHLNQCIQSCSVQRVDSIDQEGSNGTHVNHAYRLGVNCAGYSNYSNLNMEGFSVQGEYSPLSKIGVEKIAVRGPYSNQAMNQIETSFRCDSDPWRSNSTCTVMGTRPAHTSTSGGGDQYEVDWRLCDGVAAPLSRSGRDKILAAVAAEPSRVPLPAPIIVSPGSEAELPNYGDVVVEVKHPSRQGWFTNYHFPDTVALTWWYLGPDNAPHSPENRNVIPEITGVGETSANRVVAAQNLSEGKWRIVAAFPPTSEPSQKREFSERIFWIGSKVDAAKASATILEPGDDSLHPGDPVHARVAFESASNPAKPKAPSASASGTGMTTIRVEVQWVEWSEKNDAWNMEFAQIREHAPNAKFDLLSGGEGKFRIRARGKTSAEYKRPWSAWTTYYVGEAGARLRPAIRNLGLVTGREEGAVPAPGSSATVRQLRPPPPPKITTAVNFNSVKIRLSGLLASSEYGFEYQGFANGQWKGLNAQGHDRMLPPPKEILVPLTVFGSAQKARVRVRAEKPKRTAWGLWEEFDPTPGPRAPMRPPPSPAPSGSDDSKLKIRTLRPPP